MVGLLAKALPLVLLAAVLLSGCASKPKDVPSAVGDPATGHAAALWMVHPDVALAPGQAPVQARFPYEGPLNSTTTFTGSFAPQQVCPLGACVLDQQVATLDITAALPTALRLRVTADLATPGAVSTPFILPNAPQGDRLLDAGSLPTATGAIDRFLLHHTAEGPVQLLLLRGDEGSGTGAYTLKLTVEVLTGTFDAYTPLGVQVPAGTTAIAIETATPGGSVRAWDAKDTSLGEHSLATGFLLLRVTQPGEAVLQFTDVTATTRIFALAPNGTTAPHLRVLGQVHPATGATPIAWTFDAGTVPFGVGLHLTPDPALAGIMSQANARLTLAAPGGRSIGTADIPLCVCGQPITLGAWGTPAVAGSYAASFTSSYAANVQLTDFVESYQR
jgi:hypothetical protein